MKTSKYVVLGGGMVAGYAAKEMVERGLKPGELTIVSADSAAPYERPPLSKGFLAGKDSEESIRINAGDFYGNNGIDLRLNCHAAGIDARRRILRLRSGEELGFEKLIIATGAEARKLRIPGSDLAGIYYLRSIEDSKRIQTHAAAAKRAVVVGGGFISMEVASVLAQKGIATSLVLRDDRVWKKFFTPAMSRFFEAYFSERGVEIIRQAQVTEATGRGALASVALSTGEMRQCEMMVAGVGVRPATDALMDSGIELGDGVVVNPYLETAVPGIYAAGDVANYEDTLFGKRRRVEHWDNAVAQGQHCGRALLGDRTVFTHVPYFFSDVFDLSYEFWGDTENADETVERGDVSSSSFSVWWLRQKQVVAAFTMNRPDEEREAAPKWIAGKQRVSAERLRSREGIGQAA
jgi:NADPH-dependent 2,4-dienoyl-CoA reductase/sulfur reductase-like enzyme